MDYEIESEEELPSGFGASEIPPLLKRPEKSHFEIEEDEPLPGAVSALQPAAPAAFKANEGRGLKKPGNLDPYNRPELDNGDGTYSTTSSISIGTDEGEVLIPTVVNGKRLSNDEAIEHYRSTGQHLGVFDNADDADVYSQALHEDQAAKRPNLKKTTDTLSAALAASRDATDPDYTRSKGPHSRFSAGKMPEITIEGVRDNRPETPLKDLPAMLSTQIGSRIEKKIAGVKEFTGNVQTQNAKADYWRSVILPRAVKESAEQGIALTDHPDVIENAKRIGLRPDQFARDWPKYANMDEKDTQELRASSINSILAGTARKAEGSARRKKADQIAADFQPLFDNDFGAKSLAFDMAVSVPDLLIGVGAGAVTGGLGGAAVMGGSLLPEYYAEGKSKGLTEEQARGYGFLMSASEVVTEIPVLEVLSHTPTGKAALRKIAGSYAESMGGKVATEAALEGVGESINQAIQIGLNDGYFDEHTTLADALQQIARAGIVGAGMGGAVGGATEGARAGADSLSKDARETRQLRRDLERTRRERAKETERRAAADAKAPFADTTQPIARPGSPSGTVPGRTEPTLGDVPTIAESGPTIADDPIEQTIPLDDPLIERRQNAARRRAVAEMSPEELRTELLTNELTGIPNRRAYEESEKKPVQASLDVDSLKWVNDNAGHEAGDQMLRAVAQALHEEGADAYHVSGDEFIVQGKHDEEVDSIMARVEERLAGATLEFEHPDGKTVTLNGLGLSYGKGRDLREADAQLQTRKTQRETEGRRSGRGQPPPGADVRAADEGLPAEGREAATEEVGGLDDLRAVRDGTASPEAIARLQSDKLITLSETGAPRLLPAGKRRLAAAPEKAAGRASPEPAVIPGVASSVAPAQPGSAAAPVSRETKERLKPFTIAGQRVYLNASPTAEQKSTGTYTKGRVTFAGLPVDIENPQGTKRAFVDPDGKPGSRVMQHHYGEIPETTGADGQPIDVFLTGDEDTGKAFVINQIDPKTGKFDEVKVILGSPTRDAAAHAYHANYQDGWKGMGSIVETTPAAVRAWAKSPAAKRAFPESAKADAEAQPVMSRKIQNPQQQAFMDEFAAMGYDMPFSPGSRVIGRGQTGEDYAVVEMHPWNGGIHLASIQSLKAGEKTGSGSRALKMVLDLADKHGVEVNLSAKKYGLYKNSPSTAKLKDWYKRNGFEGGKKNSFDSYDMVRKPLSVPKSTEDMTVGDVLLSRNLSKQEMIDSLAGRKHDELIMGPTPEALVKAGMPQLPVALSADVALKLFYRHNIPGPEIYNLLKTAEQPIMVFKSDAHDPGKFNIFVKGGTQAGPMQLSLKPNGEVDGKPHNIVVSMFGRQDPAIVKRWVKDGLLVAADRSLAKKWLADNGINDPATSLAISRARQVSAPRAPTARSEALEKKRTAEREHHRKIYRAVRGIIDQFSATNVQVVQRKEDLPAGIKAWLVENGLFDDNNSGFLWPKTGQVYLVANAINDEAHAVETMYHELVGHYGLRTMLNSHEYAEIMDGIARDMPEMIRQTALRNQLDLNDPYQKRLAAEEVIAYAAGKILSGQKADARAMSWYQRIADYIKSVWKAMRGEKYYNEKAVARIVANAANSLSRGKSPASADFAGRPVFQNKPKLYYSKVWEAINSTKVPAKAPLAEYVKILKSKTSYKTTENGPVWDGKDFSEEEWKWSGLLDFEEINNWKKAIIPMEGWAKDEAAATGLRYGAPKEVQALLEDRDHVSRLFSMKMVQDMNGVATGQTDISDMPEHIQKRIAEIGEEGRVRNPDWGDVNSAARMLTAIDEQLAALPIIKINKEFLLDRIQSQQVVVDVAPYSQKIKNQEEINTWLQKYDPETIAQIERNRTKVTTDERPYEREPTDEEREEREREFDENIGEELDQLERRLRRTDNYVDQSDYIDESARENVSNKDDDDWERAIKEKLEGMNDADFDTLMVELRDTVDEDVEWDDDAAIFNDEDFESPDDHPEDQEGPLYTRWKEGNWHNAEETLPFEFNDLTYDGQNKLVTWIREAGEGRRATPESKDLWRRVEEAFIEEEKSSLEDYYHGGEGTSWEYSARFDPGPDAADIDVEISGNDDNGYHVRVDGHQVGAEFYGRNGMDEAIEAAISRVRELAYENNGPDIDAPVAITEEEAIELGIIDPPEQLALLPAPDPAEQKRLALLNAPPKPEPKFEEIVKWKSYTIDPSDESYGERLFTWKNPADGYHFDASSHWGSKTNVLGHLRFTVKPTVDGRKIFYVEEAQSDWHQETRDQHRAWKAKQEAMREARVSLARNFGDYKALREKLFETLLPKVFDLNEALTGKMILSWARGTPSYRGYKVPDTSNGLESYTAKGLADWLRNEDQKWFDQVWSEPSYTTNNSAPPSTYYLANLKEAEMALPRHAEKGWGTKDMPNRDVQVEQWAATYSRARDTVAINGWLNQTFDMLKDTQLQRDAIRDLEDAFGPSKRYFELGEQKSGGLTEEQLVEYNRLGSLMITPEETLKRKRALMKFAFSGAMKPMAVLSFESETDLVGEYQVEFEKISTKMGREGPEPKVPPVRNWSSMMMKWAIAEAHARGLDGVGIAPGTVHGTRWQGTKSWGAVKIKLPQGLAAGRTTMTWDQLVKSSEITGDNIALLQFHRDPIQTQSVAGVTGKAIAPISDSPDLELPININQLSSWIGREAASQFDKTQPEQVINATIDKPVWGPRNSSSSTTERHFGQMDVYNNIQRNEINGFLKKYGAKLEETEIPWDKGDPTSIGLVPGVALGTGQVDIYSQTKAAVMKYIGTISGKQLEEHRAAASQLGGYDNLPISHRETPYYVYDMIPRDGHQGWISPATFESQEDAESHARMVYAPRLAETNAIQQAMIDKGEVTDSGVSTASSAKSPVVWLNEKLKKTVDDQGFPLFARRQANAGAVAGASMRNGNLSLDTDTPLSAAWTWLRYKAQDKFIDLFRTQKAVKQFRGLIDLPEDRDAYLKQTLYHGRAEERIKEHEQQFVDPLIELIKKSGYDWDQVEQYLYARHAPERNARMAAINPKDPTFGSGMTNVEAAQKMLELRQAGNIAKLDAIGAFVDGMNQWNRDTLVNEGLETQATVDAWAQTYKHYVPLKGWENPDDVQVGPVMPRKGKGFDTGGKLSKAATGRKTRADAILANIVAQARATLILAEKAKVGRALYDFVVSNPAPDHWTVDQPQYTRTVDPRTGLVREGVNPTYKLADNVVRVKRDGEDYHITFNPQDERMLRLAKAMKNLSPDQVGPILGFLHGVNRYLSAVSTSLNPEFVITNALRDVQTAMINLSEEDASLLRTRVLRDWRKAWWGVRRGEKGKSAEWAGEWERFKKAGAKVGWIESYDQPVDLEKMLQRKLGPNGVGQWSMDQIRAFGNAIERENLAVENAIRLSVFVNLTRSGMNEERAAQRAKDLTVNFNRRGEVGVLINSLYLFANASIQGTQRFFQLATSKKGRWVMLGVIGAFMGMDILNRMIGGLDDDDENRYDKIPVSEKERNMIFMLPPDRRIKLPGIEKPLDYIKIPMPYGYNVPAFFGTTMGKYADFGFVGRADAIHPGEDAAAMLGAFMGSFSPIGDTTSIGQFIAPTLADPFIQLDENRSWNGGKIYPDAPFDDSPPPDSTMAFASTPMGYKELATWLNSSTGGTEVTPGAIDISPETMQHWADFAGGGLMRFVTSFINAPMKHFKDPLDLEAREVAFIRRVVGTIGTRENQEVFYGHVKEIQYAKSEIDAIYKMGIHTPEAQERLKFTMQKYPVATMLAREMYPSFAQGRDDEDLDKAQVLRRMYQGIKPEAPISTPARPRRGETGSLVTRLSRSRQEIRRLEAREGLPAEERKRLIEAERAKIDKIVTDFNKKWSDVKEQVYGARRPHLIGKVSSIVEGKPRREQVAALKAAGMPATADLLSALPPTSDRRAMEFFALDAARSS